MEREIIADDTAKLVIEKLSRKNFESSADYDKAFDYLQKVEFDYSLLALTAHWNPDLRFFALKQLNNNLYRRPLVNARKMKNGEWVRFDKIATQFLIYLLESNPLFISGSENATIHSNYISTIALNLDLLTHENITDKKQIREWYKNDLQFEQAILKWKAHIK